MQQKLKYNPGIWPYVAMVRKGKVRLWKRRYVATPIPFPLPGICDRGLHIHPTPQSCSGRDNSSGSRVLNPTIRHPRIPKP